MAVDRRAAERVRKVAAELANRDPADHSTRNDLLERVVDAVDRISQLADDQALRAAIDAETDRALLTALSQLATPSHASRTLLDPLAVAKARGDQAKLDILADQGEVLDADEVAVKLGLTVADIDAQREEGLLVALPLTTGCWVFPSWQFVDGGLIPGLEDVLRSLPAPGPWSRILFLQGSDPYLDGQTPLELIRKGEIGPVQRLAAAYDELVAT
jgi:hypothetical protein